MKAVEVSFFELMNTKRYYTIPFFQRGYVWDTDNWGDLLEELTDDEQGHFLGSVIIKPLDNPVKGNAHWSIIDGQQRLTTMSVLLKVCLDIMIKSLSADESRRREKYETQAQQMLFVWEGDNLLPKIVHSRIDASAYNEVMTGKKYKDKMSDAVLKCYHYFYSALESKVEKATSIFEELNSDAKLFVGITLNGGENEQAIFDTINSAGVRLTSADTIKNCLFQRLMELTEGNAAAQEKVSRFYDDEWESVFAADQDAIAYWTENHKQGRLCRNTLEVLLQCVAMIEQFFNPYEKKVDQLADCYKEYLKDKDYKSVEDLIRRINKYARRYRSFFKSLGEGDLYRFDDDCIRVLHILRVCDISTFDPVILKLLMRCELDDDENLMISEEVRCSLKIIEKYVLRHAVCGASTKNFNKECWTIFKNGTPLSEFFQHAIEEKVIDDSRVRSGLRSMSDSGNKIATCVLFWMELKRRFDDGHDVPELKYDFTLEHIMPRSWGKYWGIDDVPVVNVVDDSVVSNEESAAEIRNLAIQELGNMALLNQKLNSKIKNKSLREKVLGTSKNKGVEKLSAMAYTQDVVSYAKENNFIWNELSIRKRTEKLADEFLKLW